MTELEFANAYLGEYRQRGAELQPKQCPFCHGGEHGDTFTFGLNTEKHTYKCLRGSCGVQGHFSELCREKGISYENYDSDAVYTPHVKRHYRKPEPVKVTDSGMDYIQSRKITPETAKAFGVGGNNQGEIVFPFYETARDFENSSPSFIKYRPAHKLQKGESKARREKDTKPILFGMHLCNPSQKRLAIFEGEFDAMAGYQAGGVNCVSVPSGCQDFTWLETCHEWLKQFTEITIIADNDAPGRKMLQELSIKLECAVHAPDFALYGDCKDANEILFRHGEDALRRVMDNVRPVPVLGLLNIADVQRSDMRSMPHMLSGIAGLDYMTGGLYDCDLYVWTGERGEGKSTLCTQILLEAIEQGYNVCAYSGEIPAERFKYSVCLQAAGTNHAKPYTDERTGRTSSYVPKEHLRQIESWMGGRFWLYDNRAVESDESDHILQVFEQAYRRYHCKVFLVDNLMTVRTCKRESDFFQMQADFVVKLRKLAEKLGAVIHLVVHPRKTQNGVRSNNDVGGLGTITNIACGVFSVRRASDSDGIELQQSGISCDSIVSCLKNRAYGDCGKVPLNYRPNSRRLVQVGQDEKDFSWLSCECPNEHLTEPPF